MFHYDQDSSLFEPSPDVKPDLTDRSITTKVDANLHLAESDEDMADVSTIAPSDAISNTRSPPMIPTEMPYTTPNTMSTTSSVVMSTTMTVPTDTSEPGTPRETPSTPKAAPINEHDDDIPMQDISPGKEHPPTILDNPISATSWEPESSPFYSQAALAESSATMVADPEKPPIMRLDKHEKDDGS